ncbi:TonB-dependent receptor [Idiomarina piscisalsi]|uniref:TonB-dependent receptor n=1 Tax=Idiomarina piscisalsi TaxID=1096243 RepID=A0ABM6LUN0_9GAMM|nr:TonB-dependent receptor [Idiomarina piscisalsi]ASG66317.1 TonB-dependent receptor [Idiomarina piscisalsi]
MKNWWFAALPLVVFHAVAQEKPIEIIEVIGRDTSSVVLPSEESTEGLFGLAESLQDIPRAATVINESLMEEAAINDLHDIARFAPNSFAAAGFGNPSLPTLRGQLGELYEAGMRRQAGNNGLGIPMSFNAIEGMAVVKGAPPVMLGTSQRVGGFVNLQPKTARLNDIDTQVKAQLGQWSQYRFQVDHNWILKEGEQGLRISAEYVDEDSFYDYHHHRSDDVLLAYKFVPNDDTQLDVSLEYYDVEWTDNAGINRPTQNLIDNNLYITGQGVQPNGSRVPGAGAVISPTGEVRIDRSTTLTDPLDTNTAETALLHAKFQHWLNDELVLVNRTYYQYLTREGINQNSFVEIIDDAHTFENRTELHINKKTVVGVNLRINDVLGYSQFTTEADNPIDLTGPLDNRRIPLTPSQQARLIELRPGLFVSPGAQYDLDGDGAGDFNLSDTTDSTSYQWGIFAQHELELTDKWRVTGGVRADYYDVKAKDPIAPQGTEAKSDTYSDWLSAISLSTQYDWTPNLTLYTTAYESDSTSNSMAGGTVLNGSGVIDEQNFATENTLYELGIKYAPSGARWYADAVLFDQKRSLRNRDGSNSGIRTEGLETHWHYASETGYWVTLAASYIDARWDDSAASQGTRQVADAFDNSRPDIIEGTDLGSPNFTLFPASSQQLQGIPEVQASVVAGWNITEKWSVGGDLSYTKHYPLDYLQTVFIRDQHTLNLNSRYRFSEQLNVRLDVFNATDQDNWSPVFEGGYFGATLAFPSQPVHARLSVNYEF